MKTRLTIAVLLLLVFTTSITAQKTDSPSDPTDITVLEKSWHKSFVTLRGDPNPLRPNEDLIRQTRAEKAEIRNRDYRLPSSTEPRMPVPAPRPISTRIPKDIYVYKIKVKNTGARNIRAIDWEYQFVHPDTQEVLGSQRMMSRVRISPGATKGLEAQSIQQPTRLVSADQLKKKYRDQFEERVVIHRIYYTDGPAWRRKE